MSDWLNLTQRDLGWLGNKERALHEWLYGRFLDRLLKRFGGIQQCPWCKTCVQAHDDWRFDSKTDPTIDALHCGNCGGVSRWRFELGMIPLDPIGLTPPSVVTDIDEDFFDEVLTDSLEMDWTPRDGARAIMRAIAALKGEPQ